MTFQERFERRKRAATIAAGRRLTFAELAQVFASAVKRDEAAETRNTGYGPLKPNRPLSVSLSNAALAAEFAKPIRATKGGE
jgi:hypothetical protein